MPKATPATVYHDIISVPPSTRQRFIQREQEAATELTKMGVKLSGMGTFGRGYKVGYRDPTCHLVLLTLQNEGFYDSPDHQFRLTPGDLLISPRGVPMMPSTRAANLLGKLVAEYLDQSLRPQSIPPDPYEARLQAMWKTVEQSPSLDWSQEQMCRRLGVSPATLQRWIRQTFDSTPQQMVIGIRMMAARRLLQQSDYPLAVISQEVGYADAFVFSAAFKRYHGNSPSKFRKAL